MAKDWKTKEEVDKEREREDEDDAERDKKMGRVVVDPLQDAEAISKTIGECNMLIEQLSQLYKMYAAGVEKRPPIEVRKRLEFMLHRLSIAVKTSVQSRFHYQMIYNKYISYRDLWDKILKDLEKSGGNRRRTS